MRKIVIFNVGGALSSYLEFDDLKIVIDLGSSGEFSPVNDFLIPLAEKRCFSKSKDMINANKYHIDQLFLSHLDKDHISDYEKFKQSFHPDWMTCPNDNDNISESGVKQNEEFKIKVDLLGEGSDFSDLVIKDIRSRRPLFPNQPLGSKSENIKLYFIKPKECEDNDILKQGYANNISLVLFIVLNEKTILLPGDILKEGMEYLINNDNDFKGYLNNLGIDFLVAPHHGLQTSFSERLFKEIKGGKTRLNIISEKSRSVDSEENRSNVDTRYYLPDYSTSDNDLKQNAVKTSMGHIVIDLETAETEVKQINDNEDLIKEFLI